MNALEYLKSIPKYMLPQSREGNKLGEPSNSELRRWLNNQSVIVNGAKPKPKDTIIFPVIELIFFPKGNRITMIKDNHNIW